MLRPLSSVVLVSWLCSCGAPTGEQAVSAPDDSQPAPAAAEEAAAPPRDPPPVSDEALPATAMDDGIDADWWTAEEPCPHGAVLAGEVPPAGKEVFCKRRDGQRHGPTTLWHRAGRKAGQGMYRDGKKDGVWTWWTADGTPWRQIEYQADQRDGRIILWNRDGSVSRVEEWTRGNRVRSTPYEAGEPVTAAP